MQKNSYSVLTIVTEKCWNVKSQKQSFDLSKQKQGVISLVFECKVKGIYLK